MLFPVKAKRTEVRFIRLSSIYYIEADGDDILIRTRAKGPVRSCERLGQAAERLAQYDNFFRTHRSYIVNLERVTRLRIEGPDTYALQLAPPVNKWIPISEQCYCALRQKIRF